MLSPSKSVSVSVMPWWSMGVQPSIKTPVVAFNNFSFSKQPIFQNLIFSKPIKQFCIYSKTHIRKERKINVSAASLTAIQEISKEDPELEKLEVVVKPISKPRLVLKFIWKEKSIGLGLDQVIPGHGTIPLSPYYFWPRKDAWEELNTFLESTPWISQKQLTILLNQAADIINFWEQSGGDLS